MKHALLLSVILALMGVSTVGAQRIPVVRTLRVPELGVQPQAGVDAKGVVHIIYLSGDPSRSDVWYVRSTDGGEHLSTPIRVNSQAGSAIAMGTVRGAQLALGRNGQIHVAWSGSSSAEPKAPGKAIPMLYCRMSDDGTSFEPQRNVIQSHPGLDGGGSVAADNRGNVYVAWHAPLAKGDGEQSRRVWVAASHDDGTTFSPETAISADSGACGCCGLSVLAANGSLYVLYRTADQKIHRDITLLRWGPGAGAARSDVVGKTSSAVCVMSTSAFAADPVGGVVAAWEVNGQIFWSTIAGNEAPINGFAIPGAPGGRKHPALAANAAGQVLVVWTEGTAWNKGGSIAWQLFGPRGEAIGSAGRGDGLPAWGAPAAFARGDGSFVILY